MIASHKTLLASLGLSLAFVAGCSSDAEVVSPSVPSGTASSSLRAIHLSADAPSVDIYVNGADKAVEELAFAESTSFLEVPAGTYSFNISPAGSSAMQSVLDIEDLPLEAGRSYTAVAFDEVSSLQALALEEDFSAVPAGEIRVRAIHTAAGVGEVDIWNIPESGSPAPLYENVGFGAVGEYLELPAAAYTVGFDVNNDAEPDVIFELPALPEGTIANLFAVNDGSVHLLAQFEDSSIARIDPAM